MKIDTKEQLLAWIEEVRQEKGVTLNQAAIKAKGISQSQCGCLSYRFCTR